MSRDMAHAADMLHAAQRISDFIQNVSEADFLANVLVQSAVLHQLTVIGEVTKRVSPEFQTAHTGIPWSQIGALKNRIVHEYDDINLDTVWTIVKSEVPGLITALTAIVPAEPDGEEDR